MTTSKSIGLAAVLWAGLSLAPAQAIDAVAASDLGWDALITTAGMNDTQRSTFLFGKNRLDAIIDANYLEKQVASIGSELADVTLGDFSFQDYQRTRALTWAQVRYTQNTLASVQTSAQTMLNQASGLLTAQEEADGQAAVDLTAEQVASFAEWESPYTFVEAMQNSGADIVDASKAGWAIFKAGPARAVLTGPLATVSSSIKSATAAADKVENAIFLVDLTSMLYGFIGDCKDLMENPNAYDEAVLGAKYVELLSVIADRVNVAVTSRESMFKTAGSTAGTLAKVWSANKDLQTYRDQIKRVTAYPVGEISADNYNVMASKDQMHLLRNLYIKSLLASVELATAAVETTAILIPGSSVAVEQAVGWVDAFTSTLETINNSTGRVFVSALKVAHSKNQWRAQRNKYILGKQRGLYRKIGTVAYGLYLRTH